VDEAGFNIILSSKIDDISVAFNGNGKTKKKKKNSNLFNRNDIKKIYQ
jgi:hypothetical protein